MEAISVKIGGLPLLSWVFDFGPWWAALFMIVADYGIIYYLMWLEYVIGDALPPWKRTFYKTFKWNDTIFIPLFMAMAVVILQDAPKLDGWYTSLWFHVPVLILGFAVSLLMERAAMKGGQYTWAQELAPSKLWHTFIFGVVAYWLVSVLIPVLIMHQPKEAFFLAVIGFAGFVYNSYRDGVLPIPHTAHPEWDWSTWRATTRWQ